MIMAVDSVALTRLTLHSLLFLLTGSEIGPDTELITSGPLSRFLDFGRSVAGESIPAGFMKPVLDDMVGGAELSRSDDTACRFALLGILRKSDPTSALAKMDARADNAIGEL